MKLSISNIAWQSEIDTEMYQFLKEQGFAGLEIAPTRIFSHPYDHITEAKEFAALLKAQYGLCISSMQSIWYGRTESIFGTNEDRQNLIAYTKKAIDFAEAIGCQNLVFGCPKNRVIPSSEWLPTAISFFTDIGNYAKEHSATIAIEANPPIYNTNFINTTQEAFEICTQINCTGIKVNIDLGTMIYYGENLEVVRENLKLVNHIHISEPYLKYIQKRELHRQLKTLDYDGFFSIEMKNFNDIKGLKQIIRYIKELFN